MQTFHCSEPVMIYAPGACRVCGCTDRAPCQDNGDGVPCCWLDAAHTLCDNIECIAQVPLEVLERLLEERGL